MPDTHSRFYPGNQTECHSLAQTIESLVALRHDFHRNDERANAYLFISVIAYHILHTIVYKMQLCGDHRSWATIGDILSTHRRLAVEYNVKDQNRLAQSHLCLYRTPEPKQRLIYQRLNLNKTPLPLKIATVK